MKERREREKLEQRQRILNAALEIISKEGFAALTMRKLAERIEYSAATIYLSFKSREEIAQELCEEGFLELLDALSAAGSGKQATEALHALSGAYVAFGLLHPEIYRLIFMGDSEYMTAAYAEKGPDSAAAKAYGILVELAGQLKAVGKVNKEIELTTIADMIWSMLHGIVSLRITCAGFQRSSPEALTTLAAEVIAKGLDCAPSKLKASIRLKKHG
ncbi:MAG: TetR/AcrR family transcriptional regulator [Acidobacteriota bacterium]|nr:TetR/AcrR family transcriptional regulator [Acidobacteriota bacterium]